MTFVMIVISDYLVNKPPGSGLLYVIIGFGVGLIILTVLQQTTLEVSQKYQDLEENLVVKANTKAVDPGPLETGMKTGEAAEEEVPAPLGRQGDSNVLRRRTKAETADAVTLRYAERMMQPPKNVKHIVVHNMVNILYYMLCFTLLQLVLAWIPSPTGLQYESNPYMVVMLPLILVLCANNMIYFSAVWLQSGDDLKDCAKKHSPLLIGSVIGFAVPMTGLTILLTPGFMIQYRIHTALMAIYDLVVLLKYLWNTVVAYDKAQGRQRGFGSTLRLTLRIALPAAVAKIVIWGYVMGLHAFVSNADGETTIVVVVLFFNAFVKTGGEFVLKRVLKQNRRIKSGLINPMLSFFVRAHRFNTIPADSPITEGLAVTPYLLVVNGSVGSKSAWLDCSQVSPGNQAAHCDAQGQRCGFCYPCQMG